jgi:hypothetical protein
MSSQGGPSDWPASLSLTAAGQLSYLRDECALKCREALSGYASVDDAQAAVSFTAPWGLAGRMSGRLTYLGGMLVPSQAGDRLAWIYEQFRRLRDDAAAVAIVERDGSQEQPWLELHCEHRDGPAFHVTIPWQREWDDRVTLLVPTVAVTNSAIWDEGNG